MWISLKMLCSKVPVTFADHLCHPRFLTSSQIMHKRDSDGFFTRRLVCKTSDSSYNLIDSSLVTVDLNNTSWLITTICVYDVAKVLIKHTCSHAWPYMVTLHVAYYVIVCNHKHVIMCILVVTLCCRCLVQGLHNTIHRLN